ncbi:probable E3 ubiquitin-protein ligase MID2 [Lingula anatina]|uniref:Probable E3 ubiquitin-protein ligase MID2 n=1 Tax=Lingula anatina TaxID=7574 RepID=A0A1S3IMG9_LINAN|nr:probable E3 ubiquitin-protein ligase MID2 [Lingula anatina]|eukprot:XP_013399283.1 probable E3 ubiquitin-protein ligase MID2 [Lingula anatina]
MWLLLIHVRPHPGLMAHSKGARPKEQTSGDIDLDLLTCSICLEAFTEPVGLPCLHPFCKKCLKDHVRRAAFGQSFSCPLCRKKTTLPRQGVDAFPNYFVAPKIQDYVKEMNKSEQRCDFCWDSDETVVTATSYCITCKPVKFLCSLHLQAHRKLNVKVPHKTKDIQPQGTKCSFHPRENVVYFCFNHGICLCILCAGREEHTSCRLLDLNEGFTHQIKEVQELAQQCETLKKQNQELTLKLKKTCEIPASPVNDWNGLLFFLFCIFIFVMLSSIRTDT